MPCEYFMVGPSVKRSFFLLDSPRHVNALECISKTHEYAEEEDYYNVDSDESAIDAN